MPCGLLESTISEERLISNLLSHVVSCMLEILSVYSDFFTYSTLNITVNVFIIHLSIR